MSLRDQLRARTRPALEYELPIGDVVGARQALVVAQTALRDAKARVPPSDDDGYAAAQAAVEEARTAVDEASAALDACYLRIVIQAMKPRAYEKLVREHPPREGTADKTYNEETFPHACFLACATELTPEEWEEFLDENLSWAEGQDLFVLAVAANERLIDRAVPKG